MTTQSIRNSISPSPLRRRLFLAGMVFSFVWLALSLDAWAVCQEGCDINLGSTFLGNDALSSNTIGFDNTGIGAFALFSNTTGGSRLAVTTLPTV